MNDKDINGNNIEGLIRAARSSGKKTMVWGENGWNLLKSYWEIMTARMSNKSYPFPGDSGNGYDFMFITHYKI